MARSFIVAPSICCALLAACGPAASQATNRCVVSAITDGDTIRCTDGERVRLLLIDTPEMGQGAWGDSARSALSRIIQPGTEVALQTDVQPRDQYGRLLAHVLLTPDRAAPAGQGGVATTGDAPEPVNIGLRMVRGGYAVVLVYPPNVRHDERFRAAADSAKAERLGLWGTSAFDCLPIEYRRGRCR
jgi:micrococcal nuclease